MRLSMLISQVGRQITRAPLRTGLTTLGVVIGTAAVVSTLVLGSGAKEEVQRALKEAGPGRLIMYSDNPKSDMESVSSPLDTLNTDDYRAIRESLSAIADSTALISLGNAIAAVSGRNAPVLITGIDSTGFAILRREIAAGYGFGSRDVEKAQKVCALSTSLEALLFAGKSAVGHQLRINDIPFQVTATLADEELQVGGGRPSSIDRQIFVPYTTLTMALRRQSGTRIVVTVDRPELLAQVKQRMIDVAEGRRGGRRAAFMVVDATRAVRAYSEGSQTMSMLLAIVGGVSLVVGGLGIMNTMLMSVTERTREIGVLLAIGARPRTVLWTVLIESVAICLSGGFAGVALGCAASALLGSANGWPIAFTWPALLIPLLCSAIVGVGFGYAPASRASYLNPVDALRSA